MLEIVVEKAAVSFLSDLVIVAEIEVPLGQFYMLHPGFTLAKSIESVSGPEIMLSPLNHLGSQGIGVDVERCLHFMVVITY